MDSLLRGTFWGARRFSFSATRADFVMLRLIQVDEPIERRFGVLAGRGLPDRMKTLLRFGLQLLRQFIQHVRLLVRRTALFRTGRPYLLECRTNALLDGAAAGDCSS